MEPLIFNADQIIYCNDETKWFDHYMPVIPSNAIINKTITGFGATTAEITANRNSIVVLPNVATIVNKYDKHKDDNAGYVVMPVYEKIDKGKITSFIKSSHLNKKFLTTPESLSKIIDAFKGTGIDVANDYFMLLDEAHKYIKDNGYRPEITKVMNYFFAFKLKAMISSTAIKPSDPRFAHFQCIKLQPTFKYDKPIELRHHENTLQALKDIFNKNTTNVYCIFFNSLNGIIDIIKKLDIGDRSTAFCSKESALYLRTIDANGKLIKAESKFNETEISTYNFFTSSLFNGLDINLSQPPVVILISEPNDPKTYLDPFSDVIQILGRFRKTEVNPDGYCGKAIHLVQNVFSENYKSSDEVSQWLNVNETIYRTIYSLMRSNPVKDHKKLYDETLERLLYSKYLVKGDHLNLAENGLPSYEDSLKYDYFRIDNLYDEERVNKYYCNPAYLWYAYRTAGYIVIDEKEFSLFNFSSSQSVTRIKKDKLNLQGSKRYSQQTIKQLVSRLLDYSWMAGEPEYETIVSELTINHPLIKTAFYKLGPEKIEELGFKVGKIKQALIDHEFQMGKNHYPLMDSVYSLFTLKVKISLKAIKDKLQKIYEHYGLINKAKATDIVYWFEAQPTKIVTFKKIKPTPVYGKKTKRLEERAYILLERKFNVNKELVRD